MPNAPTSVLDAELAAFMRQGGLSLTLGSCDADNRPSVGRAVGCRIAPDLGEVRLFVSRPHAAPLLAHVRETGRLSAVFSRPSTHQTLQLKGTDAQVLPAEPGDAAIVLRHCAALVAELGALGYPPEVFRALLACAEEDIVALRFTPAQAFSATPGPDAGRALQAAA